MTALVLCPCRHPVEEHERGGCNGDRFHRCHCPLRADEALDAAIDAARSTYGHDGDGAATRVHRKKLTAT